MNSAVPFWFQSAAGGAAPVPPAPGFNPGNSIRFNNEAAQSLRRTFGTNGDLTRATCSVWVKICGEQPFNIFECTIAGGTAAAFNFNANGTIQCSNVTAFAGPAFTTTATYSDESAWYHVVVNFGDDTLTLFVNGVEIQSQTAAGGATLNAAGAWIFGANSQGYMTELRWVDGQTLPPSTFGQWDAQGAWQPRTPAAINTAVGDYGQNGFYCSLAIDDLFSSTNQNFTIGATDLAPIDTNHSAANPLTGTNFYISPPGTYSTAISASAGTLSDPGNAFNDQYNNAATIADNTSASIIFAPNPPISFTEGIQIAVGMGGDGTWSWNGNNGNVPLANGVLTEVFAGAGTISAATPFLLTGGGVAVGAASATLSAFAVDGIVLVDGTSFDVSDVADSPGSNYATLQARGTSFAGANFTSGDLALNLTTFGTRNGHGTFSTVKVSPSQSVYFEGASFTQAGAGNQALIGMTSSVSGQEADNITAFANTVVPFVGLRPDINNGQVEFSTAGAGANVANGTVIFNTYNPGDVLNFAYNLDAGRAWFGLNGVYPGGGNPSTNTNPTCTFSGGNTGLQDPWAGWAEAVISQDLANASRVVVNYGQQTFQAAVPVGFESGLIVSGLPAPTVNDGSDGCRVVQAAGNAVLECASGQINDQHGSTGFASGVWWIKDLANNNTPWQMGSVIQSGQFWATDPAQNPGPYVERAGNSVGYCFDVTPLTPAEVATVNANGTTDVIEMARNLDTGFTTATYTGTLATADGDTITVPHGLNQAPDWVLVCPIGTDGLQVGSVNASNFYTSVSGLEQEAIAFQSTDPFSTNNKQFFFSPGTDTVVDNTTITFRRASAPGVSNPVNRLRTCGAVGPYTFYAGHNVSGYQQAGTYVATDNADGAYIYTGFTPSVVIIKNTNNNGTSWVVQDSTLNNTNPTQTSTSFSSNNGSDTAATNNVDFYSNGFKILNTNTDYAENNGVFFYLAFASNPFGGNGVQPIVGQLQSPQPTPADAGAGVVSNSLRFRGAQSLTRTLGAGDSRRIFTFNFWVKRGELGGNVALFSQQGDNSFADNAFVCRYTNDNIQVFEQTAFGTFPVSVASTSLYRDTAAWYNIHIRIDTTQATATDRCQIFINGRVVNVGGTFPPQNYDFFVGAANNAGPLSIGNSSSSIAGFFDGYMADFYFIDGQALDPTAFGEYNAQGVWRPRTEAQITASINAAGGYGDIGFKLIMNQSNIDFGDPPVLQDQSGQNNDFTMNTFELVDEDDPDFDLMVDGPSTNFSTWNNLLPNDGAWEDGNLVYECPTPDSSTGGTITFGSSDGRSYYAEFTVTDLQNGTFVGLAGIPTNDVWETNDARSLPNSMLYASNGDVFVNGVNVGSNNAYAVNDVVSCRIDGAGGTRVVRWAVNGTDQATTATAPANTELTYVCSDDTAGGGGSTIAINYGQQPFRFRPVSLSDDLNLQCRNLPAAPVVRGTDFCRALRSAGQSILPTATGRLNDEFGSTGFASGLYWIKQTSAGQTNWQMMDSVRGFGANNSAIIFNGNNATAAVGPYVIPTGQSVAYCWETDETWSADGGGGAQGTIPVAGERATTGGFSIITYTGNGTAGATIAHGLPSAPQMFWMKRTDAGNTQAMIVCATGIAVQGGASDFNNIYMELSRSDFPTTDDNITNGQPPTNDVIVLGDNLRNNGNGSVYVCYAWTDISGYSSVGNTYTGNAAADGIFVYTGFTPNFLLTKLQDTQDTNWILKDATQNGFNPAQSNLSPNTLAGTDTDAANSVDFLSNGFKIRTANAASNANNGSIMYAAFGSNPFGGSNVQPMVAALQRVQATPSAFQDLASRSFRFAAQQTGRMFRDLDAAFPGGTYTYSFWFKLGDIQTRASLFAFGQSYGAGATGPSLDYQGSFTLGQINTFPNDANTSLNLLGRYRDPSAWYHAVFQNSPAGTRVWINGEVAADTATVTPAGSTVRMAIGATANLTVFSADFVGYIADCYLVMGQALAPTTFGNYNAEGVWVPVAENTIDTTIAAGGGYGALGFKLIMNAENVTFTQPPVLDDLSGNGNDFTLQDFQLTDPDGSDYPFMADATQTNACTWNQRVITNMMPTDTAGVANLSSGNLNVTLDNTARAALGNVCSPPSGGNFYYELTPITNTDLANGTTFVGLALNDITSNSFQATSTNGQSARIPQDMQPASGDVIQVALNTTSGTYWIGVDNVWLDAAGTTNSGNPNDGTNPFRTIAAGTYDLITPYIGANANGARATVSYAANFGQREFDYAPPAGYSGWFASGISDIVTPIPSGGEYFSAITYTGGIPAAAAQGTTANVTGLAFTPDMVWIKCTSQLNFHVLYDSARGLDANGAGGISSNDPGPAFGNLNGGVSAFNNGGYTTIAGSDVGGRSNLTGSDDRSYVAWCWRAGGNPTATNAAGAGNVPTAGSVLIDGANLTTALSGTIPANRLSATTTGHISCVQYNGDGTAGSIAHGLGVIPDLIMVKNLVAPAGGDWAVYCRSLGNTRAMVLNDDDPLSTAATFWNSTDPDENTFTVGTSITTGGSLVGGQPQPMVAWCFADTPGFSKFGFYVSNNTDDDGPFVYTNFTPEFLMIKNISFQGSWMMYDRARQADGGNRPNPYDLCLFADLAQAQAQQVAAEVDFQANGFKIMSNGSAVNSAGNYLYMAWAHNPFGGSNVSPGTAQPG